jgi:hypothetical protein
LSLDLRQIFRRKITVWRWAGGFVALLLLMLAGGPGTGAAFAASTPVYYISNQPGCSDQATGNSPSQPWCNFDPVNTSQFAPGTTILLRRGDSWNEQLTLNSSGTVGSPIVISAYGSGPNPVISRDNHDGYGVLQRDVLLNNPSYVSVSDLSVGNAEVGIEAYYTQFGARDLSFSNINTFNIHGIVDANMPTVYPPSPTCNGVHSHTFPGIYNSSGIVITGPSSLTFSPGQSVISGVSATNITGTGNVDTFSTQFCNGIYNNQGGAGSSLVQNLVIRGLSVNRNANGGPVPGCPDGVHIFDASNVLVTDSTILDQGGCYTPSGTTAIILEQDNGVTITHSVIGDVVSTNSPDQSAIDLEYHLQNITISHDRLINNPGPAIEFQSFREGDYLSNVTIEHNIFINNGYAGVAPYTGSILVNGAAFEPTGIIEDNVYDLANGLITGSPDPALVVENNHGIRVSTSADRNL